MDYEVNKTEHIATISLDGTEAVVKFPTNNNVFALKSPSYSKVTLAFRDGLSEGDDGVYVTDEFGYLLVSHNLPLNTVYLNGTGTVEIWGGNREESCPFSKINLKEDDLRDYLFFTTYGHPYDPDAPETGEVEPKLLTEKDVDPIAISTSSWTIKMEARFVGFYKTYESPAQILLGNTYQEGLNDFTTATGTALSRYYNGGTYQTGDTINPDAVEGRSYYLSDKDVAYAVYRLCGWAKYVGDDTSKKGDIHTFDMLITDTFIGLRDDLWTLMQSPEIVNENDNNALYVYTFNQGDYKNYNTKWLSLNFNT